MLRPESNHASGSFWIDERERIRLLLGLSFLMNLMLMLVQRAPQGTLEPALIGIRLSLLVCFGVALYFTRSDVVTARQAIVACFTARQVLLALTYPYTQDLHSAWPMSSGALVFIAFLVEISVAAQVWLVLFGVVSIACAILVNASVTPLAELPWTALTVGLVLAVFSIQVRYIARRAQSQLKSSLRSSARFLQTAIDAIPSAVAILDHRFETEMFNRAWHSLHAAETTGGAGRNYLADLEHAAAAGDADAARIAARLRSLDTQPAKNFSLTCARSVDDERCWFAVDLATFEHDGARHIVVVLDDVSEKHRATEALAKSEDQLRTMVDSALHGIISIDQEGRVREFNPAASEALGYTRDEVIGQPIESFLPAEARTAVVDFVRGMLNPPKTTRLTGEATAYRKDGQPLQMEFSCFAGATQDGPRLYTFMRNISEQRRLERLKDEMIATLSHELRTPLTSLRGFSELLVNKEFPEDRRRRYLGIIHAEAERMARLVNDFLDIRRAESTDEPYQLAPVPLAEVLEAALQLLPSSYRTNHPVHIDLAADLPLLCADAAAMARVLENLLSNACKFSCDGSPIAITAQQEDSAVVCRIQDHGIGIPANEVPHLFEKFYRGEVARTQAIGGTGLGLPICRAILQAHNGRIRIESTVGQGTTVSIEIPIAVVHPSQPASRAAIQLH